MKTAYSLLLPYVDSNTGKATGPNKTGGKNGLTRQVERMADPEVTLEAMAATALTTKVEEIDNDVVVVKGTAATETNNNKAKAKEKLKLASHTRSEASTPPNTSGPMVKEPYLIPSQTAYPTISSCSTVSQLSPFSTTPTC